MSPTGPRFLRSPRKPLVFLPHTLSEVTGPVYGHDEVRETDNDLTRQHEGEPLGKRIIVTGRVLDADGRPATKTLLTDYRCD
jgi:protocatechuate 3,4-dioxygenase, beta subunit